MHPRFSLKIAIIVGIILFLIQLIPYAIIGEYWGMIWYFLAMPFSEYLKNVLWHNFSDTGYTVICSALSAFLWSTVCYFCLRGLSRIIKRKPN